MKTPSPSLFRALNPSDAGNRAENKATLAEIDRSCCWPVLFLFTNSLLWLMGGTVLALLASWKMHSPGFLADWSWLTFGRVRPAHLNAMIYGFSSQAAIGVAILLLCRLGPVPFIQGGIVVSAAVFWKHRGTSRHFPPLSPTTTNIELL